MPRKPSPTSDPRPRRRRWLVGLLVVGALFICGILAQLAPDTDPSPDPGAVRAEPTALALVAPTFTNTPDTPPTDTPATDIPATPIPVAVQATSELPAATSIASEKIVAIINTSVLNVRRTPSADGELVQTVAQGQRYDAIGRSQDGAWVQIGEGGRELGWVSAEYVILDTAAVTDAQDSAAAAPAVVQSTAAPSTVEPIAVEQRAAPPAIDLAAVCFCTSDQYNCPDFVTHAEAQACFDYCVNQRAGDIHRLDQNNDGLACESLP